MNNRTITYNPQLQQLIINTTPRTDKNPLEPSLIRISNENKQFAKLVDKHGYEPFQDPRPFDLSFSALIAFVALVWLLILKEFARRLA